MVLLSYYTDILCVIFKKNTSQLVEYFVVLLRHFTAFTANQDYCRFKFVSLDDPALALTVRG